MSTGIKMNRLAKEKSPYLLQHRSNPVDWYPWGDEAFEKANAEDKPIFLSIGYSTCHWCHVMERESFEDARVARLLNDTFVCIKVDREERPDIDSVYMSACQALIGSGGWPLTMIMTPDRKPFYAATYIPKEDGFGVTGLLKLVPEIKEAWKARREELVNSAWEVVAAIGKHTNGRSGGEIGADTLVKAYSQLASSFDEVHGGFGGAPKFPSPHNLLFLLRYWKRTGDQKTLEMVESTLQRMRAGGIYDQLGFGFHRYATDAAWSVPHFEKMLYDQALLSMAYLEAFQATKKLEYARTAKEIYAYVLRDMTSKDGGFLSAEDADSEGIEGRFYLWDYEEIRSVLPKDEADLAIATFGVLKGGNLPGDGLHRDIGTNILRLTEPIDSTVSRFEMGYDSSVSMLEAARQRLFRMREKRVHPHKDDKILADWNGLMIASFAKAAQVLDEPKYARVAIRAADFIMEKMRGKDGGLLHRFRDGEAAYPGNLDDYAFMIWGLLELYETSFDVRYLEAAIELDRILLDHFWDREGAGFFFISDDGEQLLVRQKIAYDGAIPSGNSMALMNLLRLAAITGDTMLEKRASSLILAFSDEVKRHPAAHAQFLTAIDFALGPTYEVVIAGRPGAPDTVAMLTALRSVFTPNKVVLFRPSGEKQEIAGMIDFIKEMNGIDGKAAAYVCTRRACKLPTTNPDEMMKLIG